MSVYRTSEVDGTDPSKNNIAKLRFEFTVFKHAYSLKDQEATTHCISGCVSSRVDILSRQKLVLLHQGLRHSFVS